MQARRADFLFATRLFVLLLGLLSAGGLFAQSRNDYFNRVDSDGNGKLSLPEFQHWMSRAFHHMDRNRDGVLAPEEQLIPDAPQVTLVDLHQRLATQFAKQDRDRDGWLSASEYLAPPQ